MSQMEQLSRAERMLAEVATVEEAVNLVDYAAAARDLAKRAKLGAASVNHAMLIRLRAERKLAEMVDEGQQQGAIARPADTLKRGPVIRDTNNGKSLDELGVNPVRLHEARKLAALTDEQLVAAADEASQNDRELTRTQLLKEAARIRVPEPAVTPEVAVSGVGAFRCVVIDPPWPIEKIERDERPTQGQTLDYPTMPVWCQDQRLPDFDGGEPTSCWEEWLLAAEDDPEQPTICQSIECTVGHQLAAAAAEDGCHVYLWTTHRFLPDALKLFQRWDVTYQCLMTWRKNVGITPFSWMYDTEHVVFGRLGSLKLQRLGLRLSFDAPVTRHSAKPDVFFERVLAASPEPRLEMFSRIPRDGFTAWGNEVTGGVQ